MTNIQIDESKVQTGTLSEEPGVPVYDIQQVFKTIQALGYSIQRIKVNESVQDTDDGIKLYSIMFTIEGLPAAVISDDDQTVSISVASADVNIFAVETRTHHHYYVEDVIMSSFEAAGLLKTYKSFAIENLFHALLKTLLIVDTEEKTEV